MKREWWSCDGRGGEGKIEPTTREELTVQPNVTRRSLLLGAASSLVWWMSGQHASAISEVSIDPDKSRKQGDIFVNIFLRGGADGLNIVTPYFEDDYYKARPNLGIKKSELLLLDDHFGFNPALSAVYPLFKSGKLAVIHAAGSGDQTRSHFEAMSAMEYGMEKLRGTPTNGWLARYLSESVPENASPLRAVAISSIMPDSLRGGTNAISLESLNDFRLITDEFKNYGAIHEVLKETYSVGNDEISAAGNQSLRVLDFLNKMDPGKYQPANQAEYPKSQLGDGLKQIAFLIKNDVGLEVASLDKGGWDTHVVQGTTSGWLTLLLEDLSQCMSAFATDLGEEMRRVTVVVQTEFGRRVGENSGQGTDHGRGSFMFVLGGNVRGGKVYADWPGLAEDKLEGTGDLRVTTDYRSVLAETLEKRMNFQETDQIFADFIPKPLGIYI